MNETKDKETIFKEISANEAKTNPGRSVLSNDLSQSHCIQTKFHAGNIAADPLVMSAGH